MNKMKSRRAVVGLSFFCLLNCTAIFGKEIKEELSIASGNENKITLHSYELGANEYVKKTGHIVSGNFQIWIDKTLSFLSHNARIIEIGSGFGRDANYIESKGFSVERTDATLPFVHLLQENGYSARLFNALTDSFSDSYDLIFANCVFLHFTREELKQVVRKTYDGLSEEGILSFSLKRGRGDKWTENKIGNPRYFCYWEANDITSLLESTGFAILSLFQDDKFIFLIAKKR